MNSGIFRSSRRERKTTRRSSLEEAAQVVVLGALVLAAAGIALSDSPGPVVASSAALIALIFLLWRRNTPPILLLPVLYQWSEVATLPIATLWSGTSLNDMAQWPTDLESAAYFGLAAVVALGLGMRLGAQFGRFNFSEAIAENARAWPLAVWIRLSLIIIIVGYVLAFLSVYVGPARILVDELANVKYVGLFILAYACLRTNRSLILLAGVFLFDIVFGMLGYLAQFKGTLLVLLVAAMAARPKVRPRDVLAIGAAAMVLMFIAVFWSAIKPEYRRLLNLGTGEQFVGISVTNRLGFLATELTNVDGTMLSYGAERLVLRHGYIEFLSHVLDYVPASKEHEGGSMTLAALQHVSMPRFLFPWKAPLPHDSEILLEYTALPLTFKRQVSISIGYLGELYIDFGYLGALLAQITLGSLIGLAVRQVVSNPRSPPLITAGLCAMIVLPAAYFGTALPKLAAGLVYSIGTAILVQRCAIPALLKMSTPSRLHGRQVQPSRRQKGRAIHPPPPVNRRERPPLI